MEQDVNEVAPKLEVFISYASEDSRLAIALYKVLSEYLGSDFAHVWIDQQQMRAGFSLNDQICMQLDRTDILIVVFTGQQKESHGFTGLEIGYFLHAQNVPPVVVKRRIVTFYLDHIPDTMSGILGLSFGINRTHLAMTRQDFESSLIVQDNDPIPLFFKELETAVDAFRNKARLGPVNNGTAKRIGHVRSLLLDTFDVLKTRRDIEVNPQKKIILEVWDDLTPESMEIPGSAVIMPEGSGAMAVFGMLDERISWSNFLSRAPERYRALWKDTIESVIISSLDRLEADNSQMIVATSGDLYRVILSRRIRYYNGRREFHLYFVEVMRRNDFGDERTTRLLKGLGLACRFRFMFFENLSEFSTKNFRVRSSVDAREKARRLIRELNLLTRESTEFSLNDPIIWADLIQNYPAIEKMHKLYQPIEQNIRKAAAELFTSIGQPEMDSAKNSLVNAIGELEGEFSCNNATIIHTLATTIAALVDHAQSQH